MQTEVNEEHLVPNLTKKNQSYALFCYAVSPFNARLQSPLNLLCKNNEQQRQI